MMIFNNQVAQVQPTKDWFEFILDLDLLDNHFKENNSDNNDSFGCSLIIQFLYHANMTEQLYNAGVAPTTTTTAVKSENNQVELKTKRIRILRILAVKTASLLKWNLLKFEKEIPVAVMSDLLHIFLRYAMNINEQKLHSQLEIEKLDNYSLFALQLLHRWCIRIIVFSKFPKRPQTKTAIINVPGIVNPLQHMKDANENILRVLINNVQESVDFLLKSLTCLDRDINIPTSECFTNLNSETGNYDIIWTKSSVYTLNMLKCFINYDLGIYFFQQQNYEAAQSHFSQATEFREKIKDEEDLKQANTYLAELKSYLIASNSMLDSQPIQYENNIVVNEKYELKKLFALSQEPEKNLEEILTVLIKDNTSCRLSLNYRLSIQKIFQDTNNKIALNRICSCNLVRYLLEANYTLYSFFNVTEIPDLSEMILKTINTSLPRHKSCLNAFVQLYNSKINSNENLLNTLNIKKLKPKLKISDQWSFIEIYQNKGNLDKSLKNTLINWKKTLQTCDSNLILQSVETFTEIQMAVHKNEEDESTMITDSTEQKIINLKNFWPKWKWDCFKFLLLKYGIGDNSNLNGEVFTDIFKTNNKNETHAACIYLSKIHDLILIKKFDCALNLVKEFEVRGIKNTRLINEITLFLRILKDNHEIDFRRIKAHHKQKQKIKSQLEKHVASCKDYLNNHKVSELPFDVCITFLSFLINTGEYEFLSHMSSQETSGNHMKKQRLETSKNSISGLIELSKNISRLCLELAKSERTMARKIAREIWDSIIEIFTENIHSKRSNNQNIDTSNSIQNSVYEISYNSSQFYPISYNLNEPHSTLLSRQLIRKFFLSIKNPLVISFMISLLSTLYNIGESMVNNEIFSEYRFLWPSSIANSNSLSIGSVLDLMNTVLNNYMSNIESFDCYCIRTSADIFLASANYYDALKSYLQMFVCDSNYFFKINDTYKKREEDLIFDDFIEKTLKSMVKSCTHLNKNTHAALISQMIANNGDYVNVFKSLQDRIMPTLDEMDLVYGCLWDTTLLEFMSYLNTIRGHFDKRNICIKECASSCVNSANPNEILEKTIEAKKTLLFLKLIKYYITI